MYAGDYITLWGCLWFVWVTWEMLFELAKWDEFRTASMSVGSLHISMSL